MDCIHFEGIPDGRRYCAICTGAVRPRIDPWNDESRNERYQRRLHAQRGRRGRKPGVRCGTCNRRWRFPEQRMCNTCLVRNQRFQQDRLDVGILWGELLEESGNKSDGREAQWVATIAYDRAARQARTVFDSLYWDDPPFIGPVRND